MPINRHTTESRPTTLQSCAVVAVFLAIAIGLVVETYLAGRPVELPNAAHQQLACASYTPSHDGHTLAPAHARALVAEDLKLLAARFRCVRTYSVSEGLDEVPKIARELGLKVMLGLWISSDAPSNDKEIAHGIALANEYADVVSAVIVGNEVLLRREQTPAQLRALIERVRVGTSVPVTYADVWEFWLRNPDLAQVSSFVTVHILPYWEDQPIGIDHALDHVQNIYAKVQAAFPHTQIFIGETGWPSSGRPRLTAVPSLINEARFIREFVTYAESAKIPYNLIEAFDQPWKRIQEGTVGGYWGLYSATGEPKFAFIGSVIALPAWRLILVLAIACSALCVVGSALLNPRPTRLALVLLGTAGLTAGIMLNAQWQYMSTANRTWVEWCATVTWSLSGWLAYASICVALARWMNGNALAQPASSASIVRSWGHNARRPLDSRWLGTLRLLLLVGLAYVCLALTYDGRGRDFPLALFALPIAMFVLLDLLTAKHAPAAIENEELLLTLCVGLTACYIAWNETYVNVRALTWSGLCLLFAVTLIWRAMHPNQSAQHQTRAAELKRVEHGASNS
jgi:glucan 1,3-beta-glucosidase